MIHFILGSSGTGKTSFVTNILARLCKKGDSRLLMLVPDQSSFETENAFLELLGPGLCRNIKVFGFSRLCDYVFSETGNTRKNAIDDGVRNIIMSMALDAVEDKLVMFNKSNAGKSVLELMIHSLKEFKKDNISTRMLSDAADIIDGKTLKTKLKETALALDSYDALISQSYIDPLDDLNLLRKILADSDYFKDFSIVVDSFSGFTNRQLEIIGLLMRRSKDFYITLNLDMQRKNSEVFATTYRTYRAVKRIAVNNSLELAQTTELNKPRRFKNRELGYLENNIFRPERKPYAEKAPNVEIFAADNIYRETDYVASRIKRLVAEENYSYCDIAVVARDDAKYAGILDAAFQKYDIPYFMDIPCDIYTRPTVRLISCAVDCVIFGYDRQLLLSVMKTGLLPLSETEISDFENYLFTWNIDGKELLKPFVNNPSGFEALRPQDEVKLAEIERVRNFAVTPLTVFSDTCRDAGGVAVARALYGLLSDYGVQNSINKLFDTDDEELLFEAAQEVRTYNSVMQALEKLAAVTGDAVLTLQKFREYLDYTVSQITLGSIPRFQDQVAVATADRARLSRPRAVFVIGAIDGEFPSVPKTAGVFTENERRLLKNCNIPLTDSPEELADHEIYLAYCAVTSASEKVFVSCYSGDFSQNSFAPSKIITELARIFPENSILQTADFNEYNELWSEKKAFECLAKNFTDSSGQTLALKKYFKSKDGYREIIANMDRAVERRPFRLSDKAFAEALFSKDMHISASQLETYNLCAFQYFCRYGLKAKERPNASIDSMQFGNIVHYSMEQFLRLNSKSALNQISDEEIKASIDVILEQYADERLGGLGGKSRSFIFLYNRLKDNIFSLIKQIIRQLQYSDFVPTDFELKIGEDGGIPEYKLQIDSEHSVAVRGYIDRVDVLEKNGDELYVRIVDYKTGNKEFKLSEILYGINMQMLIYLRAVSENGADYYQKKLLPAGILYMPSSATDINADELTTPEKITVETDKNYRMNGLILNDAQLITHMDRTGRLIKLPGKIEEGMYSDNLADATQFSYIFRHIDDTVRSMGQELFKGNIAAEPLKGIKDGCAYCPYSSVCCFESGDKYRYRNALKPKEVYEKLGMEDRDNEQS